MIACGSRRAALVPGGLHWFQAGCAARAGCTSCIVRSLIQWTSPTGMHEWRNDTRLDIAGCCRGSVDADPGVMLMLMLMLVPVVLVPVLIALRGERILTTGHRRHHALQGVCPGRHGLGRISQRMARSGHAFGSELSSGCQAPQTCSWLRRNSCGSPGREGCQLRPMQSRYRCRNALWPARPLHRARRPTQPSSCQPGGRACRRLAAGRAPQRGAGR